jgi:hypothetical protein
MRAERSSLLSACLVEGLVDGDEGCFDDMFVAYWKRRQPSQFVNAVRAAGNTAFSRPTGSRLPAQLSHYFGMN